MKAPPFTIATVDGRVAAWEPGKHPPLLVVFLPAGVGEDARRVIRALPAGVDALVVGADPPEVLAPLRGALPERARLGVDVDRATAIVLGVREGAGINTLLLGARGTVLGRWDDLPDGATVAPLLAGPVLEIGEGRLLGWLAAAAGVAAVNALGLARSASEQGFAVLATARSLAEGHGPVVSPGVWTEGVTSPLWAALLALPVGLGGGLGWARALGVIAAAGAAVVSGLLAARLATPTTAAGRVAAAGAAFLTAGSLAVAAEAGGGLEGPLAGVVTALAVLRLGAAPTELSTAALVGLVAVARPEGPVLAAALVVARVLRDRAGLPVWIGVAVAPFAAWMAVRSGWYGEALPWRLLGEGAHGEAGAIATATGNGALLLAAVLGGEAVVSRRPERLGPALAVVASAVLVVVFGPVGAVTRVLPGVVPVLAALGGAGAALRVEGARRAGRGTAALAAVVALALFQLGLAATLRPGPDGALVDRTAADWPPASLQLGIEVDGAAAVASLVGDAPPDAVVMTARPALAAWVGGWAVTPLADGEAGWIVGVFRGKPDRVVLGPEDDVAGVVREKPAFATRYALRRVGSAVVATAKGAATLDDAAAIDALAAAVARSPQLVALHDARIALALRGGSPSAASAACRALEAALPGEAERLRACRAALDGRGTYVPPTSSVDGSAGEVIVPEGAPRGGVTGGDGPGAGDAGGPPGGATGADGEAAVGGAEGGAEGGGEAGEAAGEGVVAPGEGTAAAGSAKAASGAAGAGKKARRASPGSVGGGWMAVPKDYAGTRVQLDGGAVKVVATGTTPVPTACREADVPVKSELTVRWSWRYDGVEPDGVKGARMVARMLDASGKALPGGFGEGGGMQLLQAAKGTHGWETVERVAKPPPGARTLRVCVDIPAKAGTIWVRDVTIAP